MEQQPNRGRGRGTRGAPGSAGGQPNWKQGGGGSGRPGGNPSGSQPRQPYSAAPQQQQQPSSEGNGNGEGAAPKTTVKMVPRGGNGNGGNGGGDTGALGRGAMRGSRYVPEVVITRHANALSKQGASGTKLIVKTNYFRLTRKDKFSIFQYRVDFEPVVEDTRIMQALIRTQGPVIGPYIFEGTMLFLYNKLRSEEVDLQVKDPRTDALYQLKIRHVGTVDM
uniref:Uncharacterized protein n=1 Tax=Anopheles maculatus TaxID=74869 RepID=A0A182T1B7_9DIPT